MKPFRFLPFILLIVMVLLGCNQSKTPSTLEAFKVQISKNDLALGNPKPGEWLFHHPEKRQTYQQYLDCKPVTANENRKIIYIQPIGDFDSISKVLIQNTAEYIQIFFGLKTVVLKTIGNEIFPDSITRAGQFNDTQYYAPFILNEILAKRMPADAITLMALTEKDLYPNPDWNFVFGLANLRKRVGVTSIYRLLEKPEGVIDETKSLERLIKVASHEISHMFTILHCTHAVCTMNGSNSLPETDKKPNRLCSECTAKLVWNLKIDPFQRMEKLQRFFKQHHLNNDLKLVEADINISKPLMP